MSAHDDWQHRCTEAECCYFGQPTHNTCSCHRTEAQVMQWEIDALRRTVAGLERIVLERRGAVRGKQNRAANRNPSANP